MEVRLPSKSLPLTISLHIAERLSSPLTSLFFVFPVPVCGHRARADGPYSFWN